MNRKQRRAESRLGRPVTQTAAPQLQAVYDAALQHHNAGHLNEAEFLYRQALALNPRHADSLHLLGVVAYQTARADLAVEMIAKAIAINAKAASYHCNLGNALRQQERLDEAAASYRNALKLKPDYPAACYNLGLALEQQMRLDEALACYRRAIALKPDHPDAHGGLATALLARGDFANGWAEFEWRWKVPALIGTQRNFPQPQWRGEPAEGRTLLIHAEQGFGDTLQFCRYAPLAAKRELRVILEVQPLLVRLLRCLPGVDLVVPQGERLPQFDLHCPTMSLPLAFKTTLDTVPADIPYLCADDARVAFWRERLATLPGRKVGLVWAGSPRYLADKRRSMRLSQLAPFGSVPNVTFVSLQKDLAAQQTQTPPDRLILHDWTANLHDFDDTAALIEALDLVVSVDTAVVHLTGAVGRPIWVLDRFDTNERWMTGRRDSPWYPTLRLYRQPRPGDWDAVLAEVVRDLRRFAET